jgi:hypothetical protein
MLLSYFNKINKLYFYKKKSVVYKPINYTYKIFVFENTGIFLLFFNNLYWANGEIYHVKAKKSFSRTNRSF